MTIHPTERDSWRMVSRRASTTFRSLHRQGKEGLGKAYLAAFSWALQRDYKYVFEFDADFSHNPAYLPAFVKLLERHDVVVGSRRVPGGGVENWGPMRRFISWGGSLYARTILGVGVKDLTGGFNGFRREVLEGIGLGDVATSGYGFQVELKFRCLRRGYDVVEAPILFPDRVLGKSKMGPHIIGEAMMNVVKLRLGRIE
nr:undecaprenyl-phosphate mannosyltransferase-like [Nerophis lumbriciformis]